jgi:hypothetical protein
VVAIPSKFKRAIMAGGVVAGLVCAGAMLGPAQGAENTKVPDFAPDANTGWLAQDDEFIPPPSGPGPIRSDPAHPYVSFYKWTRERLQKVNERSLSGKVVAIPKERCWPVGVPAFLLLPATPVYFLQTPKEVWMIWMQDRQIRRVFLDVPHSANVKPSWYGESSAITMATPSWSIPSQSPPTRSSTIIRRPTAISCT